MVVEEKYYHYPLTNMKPADIHSTGREEQEESFYCLQLISSYTENLYFQVQK